MGTEYYLVKPDKQEIFYLGKHMSCPEGIHEFSQDAHFIDYYSFHEFFWDFLDENYNEFVCLNLTLEQLSYILFKVYDWSRYDKIYFDNDCNNEAPWINWKETGSLQNLLEEANFIYDINCVIRSKHVDIKEEELAKYLFDGDSEKAKILLELIHEGNVEKIQTIIPTPIEMVIDEDD